MKISVLGLGESLSDFTYQNDVITIGVNDIWRRIQTDYVVCVDPPRIFSEERLTIIKNSKPKKFLTDLIEWKEYFRDRIELFERQKPRSCLMKLDESKICYSVCSPYVACVIAYKMGANEIIMYGCDFNSHKTLSNPEKLLRIKRDFYNLQIEFKKRGVNLLLGNPDKSALKEVFTHKYEK